MRAVRSELKKSEVNEKVRSELKESEVNERS